MMKSTSIGLLGGMVALTFAAQFSTAQTAYAREKIIHAFTGIDGEQPYSNGSLIAVKGTLYGTTIAGGTYDHGTVFSIDTKTGTETVLYSFCSKRACIDGQSPWSNLIDVDGTLYGTTYQGGSNGAGTAFSLDPNTGTLKVLYSFCSKPYCADGINPQAGLTNLKGILYGTTDGGGVNCAIIDGCGAVFALDPKTGTEAVIYSFCSQPKCSDGSYPQSGLIDVSSALYGTTPFGGKGCYYSYCGQGTVFSINPVTRAETVLYSFCSQQGCMDGMNPNAALINVKGMLYGTTTGGGAGNNGISYGLGTVFALNPNTGAEKVLYSFCSLMSCADGARPVADLIEVDGTLYGTTTEGGTGPADSICANLGCGTVFAMDPGTGAETVLHSFCSRTFCRDGRFPIGGLSDLNKTLYGTTVFGGIAECIYPGCGTVFALKPTLIESRLRIR